MKALVVMYVIFLLMLDGIETGLVARVSTYISLEVFERLEADCSACFFACERSFGSETLFRGRYTRCGTASVATTGVLVPCALVTGAFAPISLSRTRISSSSSAIILARLILFSFNSEENSDDKDDIKYSLTESFTNFVRI